MNRVLRRLAVAMTVSALMPIVATAQPRAFSAKQIVMDDGAGNSITVQTPASGWAGNIPFTLPIPPPGNPPSGFVHVGTALNQILYWNPTTARKERGMQAHLPRSAA